MLLYRTELYKRTQRFGTQAFNTSN